MALELAAAGTDRPSSSRCCSPRPSTPPSTYRRRSRRPSATSGLDLLLAAVLGTGTDVEDAPDGLMAEAGVTAEHSVLLFAVGSSDAAANADVHDLAARLSRHPRGRAVRVGLRHRRTTRELRCWPNVREPIAIVPLFLAPGLLLDPMEARPPNAAGSMTPPLAERVGLDRPAALSGRTGARRLLDDVRTRLGLRPWPSPPSTPAGATRRPPRTRCRPPRSPSSPAPSATTTRRYFADAPIAPPTFAAVIAADAWEAMFADEELGLALRRIVHGDQRFTLRARAASRGPRAGDS